MGAGKSTPVTSAGAPTTSTGTPAWGCSACQRQEKHIIAHQALQDQSSCLSANGEGPSNIDSWNFDVVEFNEAQVEVVAAWILLSIRGDCSIPESERISKFAHSVCLGYLPNSYHNSRHALDVLHAVSRLGQLLPWEKIFQEEERFALGVAAISHDIGHFGLTNVFLVDMRDELAICYNDISPLENMHCNKLFRILAADSTDVFSFISAADMGRIRKMVIDSILNTDPVQHARMVKDLQVLHANNRDIFSEQAPGKLSDSISEVLSSNENKTLIARTLLHGADLSNPAKPWKITHAWAKAVLDEFFAQGDQEKTLGLTIGMLNDRSTVSLPNSQLGFIQFMVAPFMTSYVKVFRNWCEFVPMLSDNVAEWGGMHFEETGTDCSARVQAVRDQLDSATKVESASAPAPAAAEIVADVSLVKELTVNSDVDIGALPGHMMPWMPKSEASEQQCVVVREVRRWRDIQGEAEAGTRREEMPLTPEGGQHRELVLLYVLSDRGALKSQKDIVMKFNSNHAHFRPLEEETAKDEESKNVVTVAVAADNMLSRLDHADFDKLLTTLLDKQTHK